MHVHVIPRRDGEPTKLPASIKEEAVRSGAQARRIARVNVSTSQLGAGGGRRPPPQRAIAADGLIIMSTQYSVNPNAR